MKYELTITHLFPEKMNLYGDMGNIITFKKRAEARGIEINIVNALKGIKLEPNKTDIYFFGGGQDKQQVEITDDLLAFKKDALLQDLNNEVVMLAICGGYQLLGHYYLTPHGEKAEGVGFFPIETVAPGPDVKQRCIGNISTEIIHKQTLTEIEKFYDFRAENRRHLQSLVGFENHGGRTRVLEQDKKLHLSKVISGIGDSEQQGHEGLRYKNAFGSYMHGSFLPKNPHMADLLLSLALKRKYGEEFTVLEPIDDNLEWQAHEKAIAVQ